MLGLGQWVEKYNLIIKICPIGLHAKIMTKIIIWLIHMYIFLLSLSLTHTHTLFFYDPLLSLTLSLSHLRLPLTDLHSLLVVVFLS